MSEEKKNKAKSKAEQIKDKVSKEIFDKSEKRPNLAIVVFGDEHEYIKQIKDLEKEAKKCGIDTNLYVCEHDSSQAAAEGMLEFLNVDGSIDAIYIQKPVPEDINFEALQAFIEGDKEIDYDEELMKKDEALWQARIFEGAWERFCGQNKAE